MKAGNEDGHLGGISFVWHLHGVTESDNGLETSVALSHDHAAVTRLRSEEFSGVFSVKHFPTTAARCLDKRDLNSDE